jgi:hypothetical protein
MEKLDKLLPGWLFVAAWAVFSGRAEAVSGLEAPLYRFLCTRLGVCGDDDSRPSS